MHLLLFLLLLLLLVRNATSRAHQHPFFCYCYPCSCYWHCLHAVYLGPHLDLLLLLRLLPAPSAAAAAISSLLMSALVLTVPLVPSPPYNRASSTAILLKSPAKSSAAVHCSHSLMNRASSYILSAVHPGLYPVSSTSRKNLPRGTSAVATYGAAAVLLLLLSPL
jgi:hypothetical protein